MLGRGGELGAETHVDYESGAVAGQRREHRKPVYAVVERGVVGSGDVGATPRNDTAANWPVD